MRRNSRRYFCNFYASLKLLPKFLKIAPRRAEQFCKQMVGARFLTAGPGIKSQTREDGARAQPRGGERGPKAAPGTSAHLRVAGGGRTETRRQLRVVRTRVGRPHGPLCSGGWKDREETAGGRRGHGRSPPRRPRPSRARNRALRGKADCAMGQGARTPQGQGERGAARRAERREARCTPRLLPEAPSRSAGRGRGAGGAGRVRGGGLRGCAARARRAGDRTGPALARRRRGAAGLRAASSAGGLGSGPGPAGGRAE